MRRRRRVRGERGYVIVMTALILIPLMGATGFAVDVGGWYSQGIRMQRAADAAALAGVVWLPDLERATTVAHETTARNGFTNGVDGTVVTVSKNLTNARQLMVVIHADGDMYFSSVFLDEARLSRRAVAEYVMPVPLGSPRNYFGTGNLNTADPEYLWASINSYCTPREQGDAFASRFQGSITGGQALCPAPGPGPNSNGGNSYTEDNPDYIASPGAQYQYIIEVPAGRTTSTQVAIWDAAKMQSGSPDAGYASGTAMTTTFTLRGTDNTPLNDDDNPLFTSCSGSGETNPRSFVYNEADYDLTILGSNRWTRLCTIPLSAPAGRYILDIRNLEGQTNNGEQANINNYAIFATRGNDLTACDTRTVALCPAVYGKEWISVFANAPSSTAEFYLAEVEAVHAGKQMVITLFDAGEGGRNIRVLDPDGDRADFTWRTTDDDYSGSGDTLDVSGTGPAPGPNRSSSSVFNERFIEITVDLPVDYATEYPGDKWWKIEYEFTSSVTDRSTWSVRIIGDPVRLVE